MRGRPVAPVFNDDKSLNPMLVSVGGLVTLVLDGEAQPIASYEIGSDAALDGCDSGPEICYALRVGRAHFLVEPEPVGGRLTEAIENR